MGNLHSSRPHRNLPAELNREIFLCLKPATQRKFICGLGRDFYAMFRQKLLKKTKRICNPDQNGWKTTWGAIVSISRDGLCVSSASRALIYAEKGFAISGQHFRVDSFPGTIIYYYEVKILSESWCFIGLTNGTPISEWIGKYPNSYAISVGPGSYCLGCDLGGATHLFELPDGAIRPKLRYIGRDVYGCGLVLDPNDKLAIFFTLNGILMGRQFPISPSLDDCLYPAVTLMCGFRSIEANFGNDKDKPFVYDIKKCPGMGLDCI